MKLLRAFEAWIVRAEAAIAVSLVLVMLALAGYNVVYRNVLVPMQKHWAHSGPPPIEVAAVAASKSTPAAKDGPTPAPAGAAEGFGGDWGEGGDAGDGPTPEPAAEPGAAEGFAGDWGEGADEPIAKADPKSGAKPNPDDAGAAEGFGGDWGEDGGEASDGAAEVEATAAASAEVDDDDDGETFTKLARIDARAKDAAELPKGGPPPAGSFAARMVSLIDALKLGWIDVVLRQLVILVSFFGAMMATQRGKHINVDVFGKLIGPRGQRPLAVVTNLLATVVCAIFARAGAGLVAISREHPHELVSWADEWMFQLMFPFGFGLLAFHFGVQVLGALAGEARTEPGAESGGAA